MKSGKIYGIALILGSVGSVLMMAFHPTLRDGINEHNSTMMLIVHLFGMINFGLSTFGLVGLSRRLGTQRAPVTAAMIAYAFAGIAVITPVAVSAFIFPALEREYMSADSSAQVLISHSMMFSFQIIQAFAKIYVLCIAAAIVFWSFAMLRNHPFSKWLATAGLSIAAALWIGLLGGHLKLDVHGFGAAMLATGIWSVWTAVLMITSSASNNSEASALA